MKISQNGINLIKKYEGCRLEAYKCPAGVWTIGYGHTSGVNSSDKITQQQAEQYLVSDLVVFENKVNKYSKYNWTQNEFDALVSFAYNIGSIDQLTANGTRTKEVIAAKILQYNKVGGKVLSGLVKRRKEEHDLFISNNVSNNSKSLKVGSKGEEVKLLQQKLNSFGYVLNVDGIFGDKTLEAVKQFQQCNGLSVDGIVGSKTWSALDSCITVDVKRFSLSVDGNENVSNNFKVKEFRCKDGSDLILIDVNFVKEYLQKIRDHFGVAVNINSAYRTSTYNVKVGGAKNSYHVKGQAFDIVVKGKTPSEVAKYAQSLGIHGIIQYNTFVHVDSRSKKYWARNNNGKVTVVNNF